MWKKINFLVIILFSLFLLIRLLKSFSSSFELYHENHNVQKGEASLYKYYDKQHCFSETEKEMISNRFKQLDFFNNKDFIISDCGSVRITFDIKDYDAWGYIYLYSDSSYETLKKWFETSNYDNVIIYDDWISVIDSEGEINIYRNNDNHSFRIIYQTPLPYKYKINEINTYSTFVKYFLELNQRILMIKQIYNIENN